MRGHAAGDSLLYLLAVRQAIGVRFETLQCRLVGYDVRHWKLCRLRIVPYAYDARVGYVLQINQLSFQLGRRHLESFVLYQLLHAVDHPSVSSTLQVHSLEPSLVITDEDVARH